jgi:hypothetical protein
MITFNNQPPRTVARLSIEYDARSLTGFYRASPEFARQHGNRFFGHLLDSVDLSGGKYISIDSRSHMLMPGWYPCIPGWHCDDFWRPEGQPDLEHLKPIKHFAVVLGAHVSTTEFLAEPIRLPAPSGIYEAFGSDRPLYAHYNEYIEDQKPRTYRAQSGCVFQFGGLDFHRGLPAEEAGWRSFTRITVSDHREPKNEIRTQTQVYLTAPFEGW